MISDIELSGKKCNKRGGVCGPAERCAVWIWNGDDREGCVNEYHCDTFGRLANDKTKGRRDREWFSITCSVAGDRDWITNAYTKHETEVPALAQNIQDKLEEKDMNEVMKTHWRYKPST